MKSKLYDDLFYKNRYEQTLHSANTIFRILNEFNLKYETIIDFGCGVGAFLNVSKKWGAKHVTGVEGPWVPKDYLMIDKDDFYEKKDLVSFKCKKKYDLAICLEVIEHLDSRNGKKLVKLFL